MAMYRACEGGVNEEGTNDSPPYDSEHMCHMPKSLSPPLLSKVVKI